MLLIFSLFLAILSLTSILVILNYAVYSWENQKITDLAGKIKEDHTDDLLKGSAPRSFTTYDLTGKLSSSNLNEKYQHALTIIRNQEAPLWLLKLKNIFRNFRADAWKTIKKFFQYLSQITSPVEIVTVKDVRKEQYIKEKEAEQHINIVNTIEKVQDINSYNHNNTLENIYTSNNIEEDFIKIASKKSQNVNLNNFDKFEQLESRILRKLRESGLEHYDIWLDLGNLYLEFEEKEKAKEVFLLVLKHANGKEKDLARNQLYSL